MSEAAKATAEAAYEREEARITQEDVDRTIAEQAESWWLYTNRGILVGK